jgi:ribonucleotide reductase beta subunit family protein with ferritin-like domain
LSVFEESLAYKPFKYTWAAEAAKKQSIDMFWDIHEVELQDDIRQYNTKGGLATPTKSHEYNKKTIDTILPLFTELDRTVADGYIKLLPYTKNNEIKTLLITQAARETVHQRAYALLAETLGFENADWSAFNSYKEMRDKIEVMVEGDFCLEDPVGYAKALVQILLGEGIGLFAAFTALLNYKRFGLISGFNDVNQWSLSDETFHVENNIKIVKAVVANFSYPQLIEMKDYTEKTVEAFVKAECNFIDLIGEQEDLSIEDFKGYIRHLGDLRLFQLSCITLSEVSPNPLEWMDWLLTGEKHDNFFEKKVTSYSHDKMKGEIDYSRYTDAVNQYIKSISQN